MTAPSLQPKAVPDLVHGSEEALERDGDLTAAMARSRYRIAAQRISPPSDNQPHPRELKGFAFFSARTMTELLPWIMQRPEHGISTLPIGGTSVSSIRLRRFRPRRSPTNQFITSTDRAWCDYHLGSSLVRKC